jgi:hypothetical protein
MLLSKYMVTVSVKFGVENRPEAHVVRRLGQSSRGRNDSTCGVREYELCVCWASPVCVKTL